jgi:hypothetical protein
VVEQNNCCADCRGDGPFDLHHCRYPHNDPYGEWGDEEDEDCVVLCRQCHDERHYDKDGNFVEDDDASYWDGLHDDDSPLRD